ncbi:MAG: adenylyltransferase/cytidyltransferase family protein [Acidobacteria bacterium]|nr:adenylyltransferase/cytidyltransferase family protein [Acidobacteriota bacterium]
MADAGGRHRVLALDDLLAAIHFRRASGAKVALANGLFDILHVGHLRYLEAACREADILVVAVNGDASAARLKGPGRPIVPAVERAEILAGFGCVDYVTIFDDDTVSRVILALRPEVHCKGTDYTLETVPERDAVASYGGRVAIVGDPKAHATRDLIEVIRGGKT